MKIFERVIHTSFLVVLWATLTATTLALGQATEQDIPPASDQGSAAATAPAPNAAPQEGNPANDPPGRVGRLQYISGSVSVQPHGTDDWVQGSVNRPLTNADNVWADKDSRAELDLGTGFMRINSESSLTLTNVNNDTVQVELHQGTLNVHVRHLYNGEVYEIDTPNLAFTVTKAGDFRFDVDPNGDTTQVIAWKGEGEATGQGPAVRIHAGEQVNFSSGTSLAHETHEAPKPDGFDEWCQLRNKREDNSVSAQYVAPGTVGSDDLDDYGTWRDTPDYGEVWTPSAVAPGWTPYSDGDWMWEDPWGWTWVDNAPWGFAPFHYGRWVNWGGGWGWAPGPYWGRPWYAPALVGWFGGPGWGLGFGWGWGGGFGFGGWGGFGWCPLGWGEPFYPWYGASRGYFRNVNINNTRITNINRVTNNYYNHGARYGTQNGLPRYASTAGRAASRDTLSHGLSVANHSFKISPSQLKGASAVSRLNAAPTHAAMLGAHATPASARAPASALSRPTVSRMKPPSSSRSAAARGAQSSAARGASAMARNAGSSASRAPERTAANAAASGARNVPRPPSSLGNTGRNAAPNRSANNGAMANRNVPRPPSAGRSSTAGMRASGRSEPSQMASNRNVPRPPSSSSNGRISGPARGAMSSPTNRSYNSSGMARNNVPRPTGPVQPAPRNYSAENRGGSYGGYRGGSSYGGYGGYRGGSSYSGRGYSSPYGGRSYSAPSYSGRGYSGPSHSSGSYGGFGGYHGGGGFGGGGYHGGGGGGFHGGGGGGGFHGGGGGGGHGGGHR